MATLNFTTQGIDAGYGEEGFFAFGVTDDFMFDDDDWDFGPLPKFDKPGLLRWAINGYSQDAWVKYETSVDAQRTSMTSRKPVLLDFFKRHSQPVGLFWKWAADEPISLSYSFPADASLATFIMGVVAAKRELSVRGDGFMFVDDIAPAPAASAVGFLERQEPCFLLDLPTLRIK